MGSLQYDIWIVIAARGGMCFPTDSWLEPLPTFCFRLHLFSFPCFSPSAVVLAVEGLYAHKSHFPFSKARLRVDLMFFEFGNMFCMCFHLSCKALLLDNKLYFIFHRYISQTINYTCSRVDSVLYCTTLLRVVFLFNFTPDCLRSEHVSRSLPPLSVNLSSFQSDSSMTYSNSVQRSAWHWGLKVGQNVSRGSNSRWSFSEKQKQMCNSQVSEIVSKTNV